MVVRKTMGNVCAHIDSKPIVLRVYCIRRATNHIGGITMNNSEFYAYYFKGKETKLTPEEKKRKSDLAYRFIMNRRKTAAGRKSIALSMIGVDCEDIQKSANRQEWERVDYMKKLLSAKIDRLCSSYGITDKEVKAYFARNNYSLSFS